MSAFEPVRGFVLMRCSLSRRRQSSRSLKGGGPLPPVAPSAPFWAASYAPCSLSWDSLIIQPLLEHQGIGPQVLLRQVSTIRRDFQKHEPTQMIVVAEMASLYDAFKSSLTWKLHEASVTVCFLLYMRNLSRNILLRWNKKSKSPDVPEQSSIRV